MQNVILSPIAIPDLINQIANELESRFNNNQLSPQQSPQPFIKGIHELAAFLKVSPARAQKLKNEGAFPYWQDGRTLLFDPNKVREAMQNYNVKRRRPANV
jgi:hypothetical protein